MKVSFYGDQLLSGLVVFIFFFQFYYWLNQHLLNSYSVGQDVKVSINLRGREWINPQGEAKYFNSVQGWRIESLAQAAPSQAPPAEQFQPAPDLSSDEPDDLPF